MSTHESALAQAEKLSKISDNNLVIFFSKELHRIEKGESATSILNSSIIKNLVRIGVLKSVAWRGRGSKYLVITAKGLDLLESQ